MMALPPLPGVLQLTVAEAFPEVAFVIVGALGTVAGVTAEEIPAALVPTAFVAVTWKV